MKYALFGKMFSFLSQQFIYFARKEKILTKKNVLIIVVVEWFNSLTY